MRALLVHAPMLITPALACAFFFGREIVPVPTQPATLSGEVVDSWNETSLLEEEPEPSCRWWDGNGVYVSKTCNLFSVARIAGQVEAVATERALKCGAKHDTDCILAPEIGIGLPTAFLYDDSEGMLRMFTAPRVLGGADPRDVRVHDASENYLQTMEFNHSLTVEYLEGSSRVPVTAQLNGTMAYCVQLLRASFHTDCWMNLD